MMRKMSHEDKYDLIQEIKSDPLFREEFMEAIFQKESLNSIVSDIIYDTHRYSIVDEIFDRISDYMKAELSEIIREQSRDAINSLEAAVTSKILENKEEMKDNIIQSATSRVAREILNAGEKEVIKKKVHDEMMKLRSYRSDLIDLDD